MDINDIKRLIANNEHLRLELKKTTGELKDAMHTACAFLHANRTNIRAKIKNAREFVKRNEKRETHNFSKAALVHL